MTDHSHYMQLALNLAKAALGTTSPNPVVGCVIVKDGIIIGQGATQKNGRPHAETVALLQAGENARNATVYVTLEPCCHHGKTPPCSDALIQADIKEIFIATQDPYTKVNGQAIEQLNNAGITLHYGLREKEAIHINEGFFTVLQKNRPFITLKIATSLDGKIATRTGESRWISNQKARDYAHLLRAEHDAVMIGIGTVLNDDPLLTCRTEETKDRSPIRVILDTQLRTPESSQLIQSSSQFPCWIYSKKSGPLGDAQILPMPETTPIITGIVEDLASRGITRLLVEGGRNVITSFLYEGLVDELIWIRAPLIIGEDGISAVGLLGVSTLNSAPNFDLISSTPLDHNIVDIYRKIH